MTNPVAQATIEGIRMNQAGTERLMRIRVRLEEGDAGNDLDAGWYIVTVPVQNVRERDNTDQSLTVEEVIGDESRTREERLEALMHMAGPVVPLEAETAGEITPT